MTQQHDNESTSSQTIQPDPQQAHPEPASNSDRASIEQESDAWRERAIQARQQLEVLERRLAEVEASAAALGEAVKAQGRARAIDAALLRAGVSDLDAARAAIDRLAPEPQPDADPQRIVDQLRAHRPGLFASIRAPIAPVMHGASGDALAAQRIARQATTTGDRRSVLQYLRLRRAHNHTTG